MGGLDDVDCAVGALFVFLQLSFYYDEEFLTTGPFTRKKKKTNGHHQRPASAQTDDGIDGRDRILSESLFAHQCALTFDVFGRRVVLEDGHFLTLADCKVNGLSSLLQCNGNVASAAAPSALGRGLKLLLNLLR